MSQDCEKCGHELKLVSAVLPWHEEYFICSECDSTYAQDYFFNYSRCERMFACHCGNTYSISWPIGSIWCTICKAYVTWKEHLKL